MTDAEREEIRQIVREELKEIVDGAEADPEATGFVSDFQRELNKPAAE